MDYKTVVDKLGRITIPLEIRKQLQIAEGDILTIRQEKNGDLKITTPQQEALVHTRSLVSSYLQSPESSVDTFLKYRKEEAEREEQEQSAKKTTQGVSVRKL